MAERRAIQESSRRHKERVRAWVREFKLAKGCVDCGFAAHPDALQFDHLPGFEKSGDISKLKGQSWTKLQREIAKCEVVCANCHAIRTAQRRDEPGPEAGFDDLTLFEAG